MSVEAVSNHVIVFEKKSFGLGDQAIFVDQPQAHDQPIHPEFARPLQLTPEKADGFHLICYQQIPVCLGVPLHVDFLSRRFLVQALKQQTQAAACGLYSRQIKLVRHVGHQMAIGRHFECASERTLIPDQYVQIRVQLKCGCAGIKGFRTLKENALG